MNISITETERNSAIVLSGAAELRDAAALKTALIQPLDRRRATAVDVSAIERTDVALLQLLCSALRSFREAGVPFSFRGSGAFHSAWSAAGFPPDESEQAI